MSLGLPGVQASMKANSDRAFRSSSFTADFIGESWEFPHPQTAFHSVDCSFAVFLLAHGFRTLYAHGLGDVSVFFTGARSVVFHYVGKNDSVGDAVGGVS